MLCVERTSSVMLKETSTQYTEEIVKFVNDIIQTRKELLNSKVADCTEMLRRFGYVKFQEDSGFESEPASELYHKCLIPSATLLSKFESNDFDIIFEQALKHLCTWIQKFQTMADLTFIETCVDTVEKCLRYLEETDSNVTFREFIPMELETMIEVVMAAKDNEEYFNFAMELLRRFGSITCLQESITELLVKHLDVFASNLKRQKADAAHTFCFQSDFTRANTMLLVLLLLKQRDKDTETEDHDKMYRTLENFVDRDDFFTLGFLGYKCFLR